MKTLFKKFIQKIKDKKKKKDKPYAQKIIPVIIIAIVSYAIADVTLQFFTGNEISPTLTTCWFAFWGTEIIALTSIKTKKINSDYSSVSDNNEELEEFNESDLT